MAPDQSCYATRTTKLDDLRETLRQMRKLESTAYRKPVDVPGPFNGLWRQQIIEWMYNFIKICKLRHESAAAASHFLFPLIVNQSVSIPEDLERM